MGSELSQVLDFLLVLGLGLFTVYTRVSCTWPRSCVVVTVSVTVRYGFSFNCSQLLLSSLAPFALFGLVPLPIELVR